MRNWRLLILFAVTWCCDSMNIRGDELKEKSIEQLVAMLVSPNEEPPRVSGAPDDRRFRPPANYDFKAQRLICEAAEELTVRGKDAIPELLKHIHDERYSVSTKTGSGAIISLSVGRHCRLVVELIANAHDRWGLPTNLEDWWKERQNLSLVEIQTEEINRRLKDLKDVSPESKFRHRPGELRDQLQELGKTKQPIKRRYLWYEMQTRK